MLLAKLCALFCCYFLIKRRVQNNRNPCSSLGKIVRLGSVYKVAPIFFMLPRQLTGGAIMKREKFAVSGLEPLTKTSLI